MPVAVLDACVLFQGRLTDLLLHLAEAKAFEPIWSDDIHAEWMRNLHSDMGIPLDKIEYRHGEMEKAFPAANVPASPALVATIEPMSRTAAQRKDAHVVATAVIAKATVIVTHNVKDFAPHVLGHYGMVKVRPDPFAWGCSQVIRPRFSREFGGTGSASGKLRCPRIGTSAISPTKDWACPGWLPRWRHMRRLFDLDAYCGRWGELAMPDVIRATSGMITQPIDARIFEKFRKLWKNPIICAFTAC